MKLNWNLALALLAGCVLSVSSASAQWGDLKVRFVAEADPKLPALDVTKDKEVCTLGGKKKVPDESFVVGKDGGLKDVIVFLVPEKGAKVKAHPSYDATAKDAVKLDNKECRFVPHVTLVRVGQSLVIGNADPMVGHNSQFNFPENKKAENPLIPSKGEYIVKAAELTKRETRAQPISCAIHPWMTGFVLIQDHPYMATSDDDGHIEIKNIPAGKHKFQFFQQSVGYVPSNGKLKTTKGAMEIEIKDAGVYDLGEVKVKHKK